MVALVVLQSVVLAVLVVLVIGLLRTHAEVLRRLHEMGAGIYDDAPQASPREPSLRGDLTRRVAAGVSPPGDALDAAPADVAGVDPDGNPVHVGIAGDGRLTLLAFLSSGCTTCAGFWDAFHRGRDLILDGGMRPRIVVVTKSPEHEQVSAVASRRPADGVVVMSSDAWAAYNVPASPYFVLVDGALGVIGEGSALSFEQLAGLLGRAVDDLGVGRRGGRPTEARVDAELLRAGITPGHPALYDFSDPDRS
ncbi:MAG TPA: hypothetical protein VF183_13970 [Acidimicrobiales bacterium]